MLYNARAYNGMVTAPHRLASEAGISILRKGGNAVQAAVAMAAALCVAYPHMTGLGGDAFWLILPAGTPAADGPDRPPVFIDACGRSALAGSREWFEGKGCQTAPKRGPLSALTMAGAVSGWHQALGVPVRGGNTALTISDLFADAVELAEEGVPVTDSQHVMTTAFLPELRDIPGFARQFLSGGEAPPPGARLRLPLLARTFRQLAAEGLDDFYRGKLAREMAEDLQAAGSPLSLDDFAAHSAGIRDALRLELRCGTVYNCPPPTQGVSSLMILGILERLAARPGVFLDQDDVLVHAVVEATKQAFMVRDAVLADPDRMDCDARTLLEDGRLDALASAVSMRRALPWPCRDGGSLPGGDTVWFGVLDAFGNTVSCIQSIYHEFGSGLVLPRSGITWHNRGLGFRFQPGHANSLAPGRKPFHTLNPALALLRDGRTIAYGTMGGEGQPQTQAAVFARHVLLGKTIQEAVSAPRWLLGRAWGDTSDTLKLEGRFAAGVTERLDTLGHETERLPAWSSLTGHAGMLVRHPDGLLEGASDPRSDGVAACW